jgi:DNA polymerase
MENLKKLCESCQKCELGKTRTNLVFGVGNPNADLMFVGEAPG